MKISLRNISVLAIGAVAGWLLYTGAHMALAAEVKEAA